MVAARAGRNGRIYIDVSSAGTGSATPVSLKNRWSLDQTVDTFETTAFGDGNKTYVVGLPNAAGQFAGFWDGDDLNSYNLIGSSVARKLYIYPDRSNDEATYFFTTAFFSISHEGSVDGAVSVSGTWNAASVASWVAA